MIIEGKEVILWPNIRKKTAEQNKMGNINQRIRPQVLQTDRTGIIKKKERKQLLLSLFLFSDRFYKEM